MLRSLQNWIGDVLKTAHGAHTTRTSGLPSTGNGASSFHARWNFDPKIADIRRVGVTCRVVRAPTVNRLYFWALQASFYDESTGFGGAHTGLQFNPRFPNNRALNWGGYGANGSELAGTPLTISSTPNDNNTGDYEWQEGASYELVIERGSSGWRALCTNTTTGYQVAVRELFAGGSRLDDIVVWTECFARCDDPTASVEWSGFFVEDSNGERIAPNGFVATYESEEHGGCSNTDTQLFIDPGSQSLRVVQHTNVPRENKSGLLTPRLD